MLIDIILAVAVVLAVFKGYQRGLIVALFSLAALVIGLAAAIKLSIVASGYLEKSLNIAGKWLPVISFVVVFLIVVLLVRLGAKAVEKTFQMAMLGWVNRIGGIIFYVAVYITIFSVLLFYAEQMKLLQQETIQQSITYSFIQPWGPKVINGFGAIIPVFRDMFGQLEDFFGNLAEAHKVL